MKANKPETNLSATGDLALQNTVLRFSHFGLETLLYGDDNLNNETNVAIVLVVHEFIKDPEMCILCDLISVPLFT